MRSSPGARPVKRHGVETGQGFTFQIPAAYSAIVRSLENFPDAATLRIDRARRASRPRFRHRGLYHARLSATCCAVKGRSSLRRFPRPSRWSRRRAFRASAHRAPGPIRCPRAPAGSSSRDPIHRVTAWTRGRNETRRRSERSARAATDARLDGARTAGGHVAITVPRFRRCRPRSRYPACPICLPMSSR
jgi:hypothetical protein